MALMFVGACVGVGALAIGIATAIASASVAETVSATTRRKCDEFSSWVATFAAGEMSIIRQKVDQVVEKAANVGSWAILIFKVVGLILSAGCAKLLQDMPTSILFQLVYVGSGLIALIFTILIFVDFFKFFLDFISQNAKKGK